MGRRGAAPAQPARFLSGSCGARQFHRTQRATRTLAFSADPFDQSASRSTLEVGSTASRSSVRGKAEGVPPPHRRTLVGAEFQETLTRCNRVQNVCVHKKNGPQKWGPFFNRS